MVRCVTYHGKTKMMTNWIKIYQTVKKVTEDHDRLHFNTAISNDDCQQLYNADALPSSIYMKGLVLIDCAISTILKKSGVIRDSQNQLATNHGQLTMNLN